MTIETTPMILTNKQHRECHARWARWKSFHPELVPAVHGIFMLLDDKSLASKSFERSIVEVMLNALHFPPVSPMCNRQEVIEQVLEMMDERDTYGNGGYMARSVILGWILTRHDAILADEQEAA